MKIYVSLFLAAASMPVGFLAGVFGYKYRLARAFPDAMMLAATVTGWALAIALIVLILPIRKPAKKLQDKESEWIR